MLEIEFQASCTGQHWTIELYSQPVNTVVSMWRASCHMIVFFSRMEDLTNPEDIRTNIKCDRKVSLYGYLRGAYLKNNSQVHMPGILFCMCWPLRMVSFLWNIEKLSNKAETWSGGFRNSPVVNHLPECWVDADVVWLAGAAACGAFPCQVQPSGASSWHLFVSAWIPGFCLPGVGDFAVSDVSFLPDPCALPEQQKKRCLNEKEKLVYAPLSGVGGVLYDKDAVYVDLGGSHGFQAMVRRGLFWITVCKSLSNTVFIF